MLSIPFLVTYLLAGIVLAFGVGFFFATGKLAATEWYCKRRENRINKERYARQNENRR